MASVHPYLIFNGDCEAAFLLYKSVFGGEFQSITRFNEMPADDSSPEFSDEDRNRIMHVSFPLQNGSMLLGSDSNSKSGDVVFGANVSISVNADSTAEADKIFNGLSDGGTIIMALEQTFWGAYFGMFVDKFGIHWMVYYDEVQE